MVGGLDAVAVAVPEAPAVVALRVPVAAPKASSIRPKTLSRTRPTMSRISQAVLATCGETTSKIPLVFISQKYSFACLLFY